MSKRPIHQPKATPAPLSDQALRELAELTQSVIDRRSGIDRRAFEEQIDSTADAKAGTLGLDRRRGVGRRLSDFTRGAEEGELNREQFLFVIAIDAFKRENNKTFPQWTDVLEVVRLLGYRKTMPSELKVRSGEDWTEAPTAPSNVRAPGWDKRAA
jgi:hypothetical protein